MGIDKTSSVQQAVDHYYNGALSNTPIQIFGTQGNIFGFEFENNDPGSDVFIQIFDKLAANVTLGVTAPTETYRVPSGANFGKDAEAFALSHYFTGCSIAATSTRTGAGAPATAPSVHLWTWNTGL